MGILSAFVRALCGDEEAGFRPLRDATCRSFPVFEFDGAVEQTLRSLPSSAIDEIAETWLADASFREADIDHYETATLLRDIQLALRQSESPKAGLFVLLEEKAI